MKRAHDSKLSRLLSRVLRHSAMQDGFRIDTAGYIVVDGLLKDGRFERYNVDDVRRVVEDNDKQRFSLLFKDGQLLIRANQGHSIKAISTEDLLQEVSCASEIKVCVHGTNFKAWQDIQKAGFISRMNRNHVHLAAGFPQYLNLTQEQKSLLLGGISEEGEEVEVISGMRKSASIFIFVDVEKSMKAGIKFFTSSNGVVLCAQDIPSDCFLKVFDVNKKVFL